MHTNFLSALIVVAFTAPTTANGQGVGHWIGNQRALSRANPDRIQGWHHKSQLLSSMKAAKRVYNDAHATTGQKRKALHYMRKVYFGGLVVSTRFKTNGEGRIHPNFNSSSLLRSTVGDLVRAKALRRQAGIPLKLLTTRQPVDTNRSAAKAHSVRAALGFVNGVLADARQKRNAAERVDAARAAKGMGPKSNEILIRASKSEAIAIARSRVIPGAPSW
jgi:hypothetical protein